MNCRPGDLAICVRASKLNPRTLGLPVTVLYAAPAYAGFRLPSGHSHAPVSEARWVCEAPRPVECPIEGGGWRQDRFVVLPDDCLRPIRDQPGEDEALARSRLNIPQVSSDVEALHKQVDRLADIARQLLEEQRR